MAGTHAEVFNASQILNAVNQQVEGGRGYQMFYDTWPKLSKKKKRQMAYSAVLQSTAKMANALSTCTQANAQFMETIKRQEEIIKAYEIKHHSCDARHREKDELILQLRTENMRLGGTGSIANQMITSMCIKSVGKDDTNKTFVTKPIEGDGLHFEGDDVIRTHTNATNYTQVVTKPVEDESRRLELDDAKRKYTNANKDLEREKTHSARLLKQIQTQQNEYIALQNQRLDSNREQLKVIEYLQNTLQKTNNEVVNLKTEVDALHSEKHNMLSYMSHQQNVSKYDSDKWSAMQNTCAETMKTVAGIPNIVNAVQDDMKNLQNQLEIQRQKSSASSNIDPAIEIFNASYVTESKSIKSTNNCNCNNCMMGNYSSCIYNGVKTPSDTIKNVTTVQPCDLTPVQKFDSSSISNDSLSDLAFNNNARGSCSFFTSGYSSYLAAPSVSFSSTYSCYPYVRSVSNTRVTDFNSNSLSPSWLRTSANTDKYFLNPSINSINDGSCYFAKAEKTAFTSAENKTFDYNSVIKPIPSVVFDKSVRAGSFLTNPCTYPRTEAFHTKYPTDMLNNDYQLANLRSYSYPHIYRNDLNNKTSQYKYPWDTCLAPVNKCGRDTMAHKTV